jgi:hypothetical protein
LCLNRLPPSASPPFLSYLYPELCLTTNLREEDSHCSSVHFLWRRQEEGGDISLF